LSDQDRFDILEPILHGLVHELRNPIQGILASADALRCLTENSSSTQLLDMIQRECVRMEQLLADLLEMGRLPTIDRQKGQSLSALLENLLREFHKQSGVQLTAEIPPNLPAVFMDQHAMQHAIRALVQNAIESGPDGITIRVIATAEEDSIRVRIEDNGGGISTDDLSKVLHAFFSTRPRKSGLGLTIAERNIRLHGGSLQIESENGRGTTVTLSLPVRT
jgi:signal transduction histidine kinase